MIKYALNFKAGFENKCIQLFVEAYNQSIRDKSIHFDWHENDITKQFHNYINKNPLRSKWSISSNVEHHLPQDLEIKTKGFANKDLRMDMRFVKFKIRIFQSNKEYEVYFEAKNLKEKDSSLKRRYIDIGIGNFVKRKYPLGFLVGYLLEGAVFSVIEGGINLMLKNDNREKECLHPKKHDLVTHYYESDHSGLCLKHLIFDFTKE